MTQVCLFIFTKHLALRGCLIFWSRKIQQYRANKYFCFIIITLCVNYRIDKVYLRPFHKFLKILHKTQPTFILSCFYMFVYGKSAHMFSISMNTYIEILVNLQVFFFCNDEHFHNTKIANPLVQEVLTLFSIFIYFSVS